MQEVEVNTTLPSGLKVYGRVFVKFISSIPFMEYETEVKIEDPENLSPEDEDLAKHLIEQKFDNMGTSEWMRDV